MGLLNPNQAKTFASSVNATLYIDASLTDSAEGIWRLQCAHPIPTHLPDKQQIEALYQFASLVECNHAMAQMYGFETPMRLKETRLGDLFDRTDSRNDDLLRSFIHSGYRLSNGQSYQRARTLSGRCFTTTLIGQIENDHLVNVWGIQRDPAQRAPGSAAAKAARDAAVLRAFVCPVLILDEKGSIVDWNPAASNAFGYSPGNAFGHRMVDLVIAAPFREAVQTAFEQEAADPGVKVASVSLDIDVVNLAGEKRPASLTITRIPDTQPPTFCAYLRDISPRKKAEQGRFESEQRFALFMKHLPGAAFIKDAEGRVIFVNDAHKKIMGWQGEEWLGKTSYELFPPDCAARFTVNDRQVLQTNTPFQGIEPIPQKDGYHDYLVSKFPIPTSDSSKPMLGGVAIDFTDLRRAETTVRYQKTLLESVNEASQDGVLVVSPQGKWLSFNHRFLEIWSIPKEMADAALDEPALQAVQTKLKDPQPMLDRIRHLYQHPQETEVNQRLELEDGRVIMRNSSPVIDSDGKYYGRVWFFHDRTDEERAREHVRALALEATLLEEKERRRIAGILHDDIAQLIGMSQMKLHSIARDSDNRAEITEVISLLDKALTQSRTLTVDLSPPVLHEYGFVAAVRWLAMRTTARTSVRVDVQDDNQPKPLDEKSAILLFRAVQELMVNVGKHSKATRGEIMLNRAGKNIEIIVKDNGVGFDPSALPLRREQNNCFGLSSIQERLHYLGGRMTWQSSVGQGATFTIVAPLSTDA